jgi:MFS family permease
VTRARPRSLVLLRNGGFRLLVTGQTLSSLGDRALIIAFGIWAKELTGSDAAAGGAFFFVALPYLFGPFVGILIDRLPRKRVFIAANLAMAVILVGCLLVTGAGQLWLLYAVTLCYGFSGIIINPTQSTIIASIVDDAELPDANGLVQTVGGGVRLLAPLLGAALFTLVGGQAVALIDAATFVVAALCVWRVRIPAVAAKDEPAETGGLRRQAMAGLGHVFRVPAVRDVVLALGLALLVMGFSQTLNFAITDHGLHRSAAFVGVLSSAQGVGTIVAGLVTGALTRRVGDLVLVVLGIAAITAAALLYLVPNVVVVLAGALAFGAAICWTTAGLITTVQRRTADRLRGRALSAAMGTVSLPQTVSIALGAGLSLVVDYRALLVAMAVTTAGCAAWMGWRAARDRPAAGRATELVEPQNEGSR